jgi:hypothetical protein
VLGRFVENSHDEQAAAKLMEINSKVVEESVANKFPEAMLNSCTIDYGTFQALFKVANPFMVRLRQSHADSEARSKFDAHSEQLRGFSRLHQYPPEWTIGLATETVSEPLVEGIKQQGSEVPSTSTLPVDKPGYRRCTRRDGYVREGGVDKD